MHESEYAELRHLVKQKGLLDRQPFYYTYKILLTLGLLSLGLSFLLLIDNFWLQLLSAAYLAFAFTQIGFIGHDAGHREICRAAWKDEIIGLFCSLLIGVSYSWWTDTHNRHHGNPNQLGLDPAIDFLAPAFTEEQARIKHGVLWFIVKYQAYFFFPLLSMYPFSMRMNSIQFLIQKKTKHPLAEALFLVTHFILYFGLVFSRLDIQQAVLFIIVHQALFGLYAGSVFACNHKGMPILDKESQLDFLRRQVLTTRNLKSNPFIDFWYGGLNYQIEHHLFPTMARNKLGEAQKIVKPFLQAHSITYYETGVLRSYWEILQYFHQVSAPLRQEKTR
jgi:fatty acid desaturase